MHPSGPQRHDALHNTELMSLINAIIPDISVLLCLGVSVLKMQMQCSSTLGNCDGHGTLS